MIANTLIGNKLMEKYYKPDRAATYCGNFFPSTRFSLSFAIFSFVFSFLCKAAGYIFIGNNLY